MAYEIEGRLLEVCTCNVLCPCWVGEDPDDGTCDSVSPGAIDSGSIEGVDVAGLDARGVGPHPRQRPHAASWKAAIFVDEAGDVKDQEQALLKVFAGPAGRGGRGSRGVDRRGGGGRAGGDHVHGRGGKGRRGDRRRLPMPRSCRISARPASRPSLAGTVFSTIPGRPSTPPRPTASPATATSTACRRATRAATTPSRATSASPPDRRTTDVHRGPPARRAPRPGHPRRGPRRSLVRPPGSSLWRGTPRPTGDTSTTTRRRARAAGRGGACSSPAGR